MKAKSVQTSDLRLDRFSDAEEILTGNITQIINVVKLPIKAINLPKPGKPTATAVHPAVTIHLAVILQAVFLLSEETYSAGAEGGMGMEENTPVWVENWEERGSATGKRDGEELDLEVGGSEGLREKTVSMVRLS